MRRKHRQALVGGWEEGDGERERETDREKEQERIVVCALEVFAALIGYLVLGETLTSRELWGVFFISIGVVLAQIPCPWAIPPIVKASK